MLLRLSLPTTALAVLMLLVAAFVAPAEARRGCFLSTSGAFQLSSGGGSSGMSVT